VLTTLSKKKGGEEERGASDVGGTLLKGSGGSRGRGVRSRGPHGGGSRKGRGAWRN
jgi:hypothetical protein